MNNSPFRWFKYFLLIYLQGVFITVNINSLPCVEKLREIMKTKSRKCLHAKPQTHIIKNNQNKRSIKTSPCRLHINVYSFLMDLSIPEESFTGHTERRLFYQESARINKV